MYIVACYAAYLAISLSVTIWVAQTLQKSGRPFLIDVFHGNQELADSVNRLLVMGFYLINIGYLTAALPSGGEVANAGNAIELLSGKIGFMMVVLGVMHFLNLYIFTRLRNRATADFRPPFPADARVSVMEA
jgi:hypothetical protein